jgi:hypothetical protein
MPKAQGLAQLLYEPEIKNKSNLRRVIEINIAALKV